jgi:hypothetical protein
MRPFEKLQGYWIEPGVMERRQTRGHGILNGPVETFGEIKIRQRRLLDQLLGVINENPFKMS